MSAYNAGKYEEAVARLERLVQQPGTIGLLARFYLGRSHHQLAVREFRQRNFKDAAEHFEAAAHLNPAGGRMERFLIACHLNSGRFNLAAEALRNLLARNPDDTDNRVRLALTIWRQSGIEAAMRVLREGLDRRADNAELQYQLGVLHAARGSYAAAEEWLVRAIACDPAHVSAHERLAQCCSIRGDHAEALALLQRAHDLDPLNAQVGLQLSLLAGGLTGAAVPLTASLASASEPLLDRTAIEKLGEIISREPDFVDAFLSLPASEVDREVFSTLAATLEHALARHPEYADLHYHCGAVYRRLGKNAAAVEHAEQAIRINPRYVRALMLLAVLYRQSNRPSDGVQRLEEAIRRGGDYADVHYMLGRLYQKAGQSTRAREAFERALELNRSFQPARAALNCLAKAGK